MLAVRLLVIVACPLAAVFTFTAEPLTWLLGGEAYLPEGAIALQIMIWSIPIGWINSLTQYALVALDLQRRITGAFAIAVTFNIVTNLLLIPRFGYPAAALTTIASEAVLLGVFARLMSLRVPGIDWLDLIWRPALAVGIMLAALLAVWPIAPLAALLIALAIYPAVLIALRPFSAGEWAMLAPILPARVRRLAPGRLRV
jgi:O-antigen/teichoic acid export membrane protein